MAEPFVFADCFNYVVQKPFDHPGKLGGVLTRSYLLRTSCVLSCPLFRGFTTSATGDRRQLRDTVRFIHGCSGLNVVWNRLPLGLSQRGPQLTSYQASLKGNLLSVSACPDGSSAFSQRLTLTYGFELPPLIHCHRLAAERSSLPSGQAETESRQHHEPHR
jgi:hypothetical protein